MSVLKSILHHWNSTSKAYDTLHPETEVGQITDFGKGLLNQLAATTAQSVISALQTGSWFGQLLKLVLNASGVKYSIDTNGYVCLGSFFGGLIIQWGKQQAGNDWICAFPIAYPHNLLCVVPIDFAATDDGFQYVGINEKDSSLSGFKLMTSNKKDIGIAWISAGY